MRNSSTHTFHIPVMGLAFTIDTPVKVAKFGISSVISIIEDQLIEQMRKVICKNENLSYIEIPVTEDDNRAKRITAYINLMNTVVNRQIEDIKKEDFETGATIKQYFEMLPDDSETRQLYNTMLLSTGEEKHILQHKLKELIVAGSIDVNIMTKLDKANYDTDGNELPTEYSDAMAALRGYANSDVKSSINFSAGLNPR